jgi:hypothetical protein
VETDRPGQEVSNGHAEVIRHLIDNEGWTYKKPTGSGYPRLYPADLDQAPIRVPKTGHTRGCAFRNWVAAIRRAGGHWPVDKKQAKKLREQQAAGKGSDE